jgi:hypothetical protein
MCILDAERSQPHALWNLWTNIQGLTKQST